MYTHEFISSHLKQEGGNKVKARIQVKLLKYIILYSNTWCDNTSKTRHNSPTNLSLDCLGFMQQSVFQYLSFTLIQKG